jgi:hypothetical protein
MRSSCSLSRFYTWPLLFSKPTFPFAMSKFQSLLGLASILCLADVVAQGDAGRSCRDLAFIDLRFDITETTTCEAACVTFYGDEACFGGSCIYVSSETDVGEISLCSCGQVELCRDEIMFPTSPPSDKPPSCVELGIVDVVACRRSCRDQNLMEYDSSSQTGASPSYCCKCNGSVVCDDNRDTCDRLTFSNTLAPTPSPSSGGSRIGLFAWLQGTAGLLTLVLLSLLVG